MLIPSNCHTHTIYCDGKNSPEEMVNRALELGFVSLGFSGHSPVEGDDSSMLPEDLAKYRSEVLRLQKLYEGQIRIYLGMELDHATRLDTLDDFEYLIGSVHEYIDENGRRWSYDWKPSKFQELLDNVFGSDPLRLAKAYYSDVENAIRTFRPQILGHFNLITKYNLELNCIDEDDPVYRAIASDALLACCEAGAVPEINVGAYNSGRKNEPYPAPWMLKLLYEHHFPVTVSSDCHNKDLLNTGFDAAITAAKNAGYRSILILS
ncbi:MAG: histidinol-phosphatase, partial [Clostridia bacterium]|nr:histidinol-phosphatase [Clostridia bacterium]